ncbi:hypothetical protein K439DRAFT_676347 [Ramaria rubella]|nr:hypothetical protein K439DRAFT_676347 [Ramaria rubella]
MGELKYVRTDNPYALWQPSRRLSQNGMSGDALRNPAVRGEKDSSSFSGRSSSPQHRCRRGSRTWSQRRWVAIGVGGNAVAERESAFVHLPSILLQWLHSLPCCLFSKWYCILNPPPPPASTPSTSSIRSSKDSSSLHGGRPHLHGLGISNGTRLGVTLFGHLLQNVLVHPRIGVESTANGATSE